MPNHVIFQMPKFWETSKNILTAWLAVLAVAIAPWASWKDPKIICLKMWTQIWIEKVGQRVELILLKQTLSCEELKNVYQSHSDHVAHANSWLLMK